MGFGGALKKLCLAGPAKCLGNKQTSRTSICKESEGGLITACKNLKIQNSELEAQTKKFISSLQPTNGAGVSGVDLNVGITYINKMTEWNKNAVDSILLCKQDIIGIGYKGKSKNRKRRKEESRFSQLADEYVNNSEEMLQFLVQLDGFLKSARYTHDHTAIVVQQYFNEKRAFPTTSSSTTRDHYTMIFENLKRLRDGHSHTGGDQSAKGLLKKVQSLMEKHQKFLQSSRTENDKIYRKQQKKRAWRKMLGFLVVGSVVAMVVCAVVMAVVACPAVIPTMAAIVGFIGPEIGGHHWITSLLNTLEGELKKEEKMVESMHDNSRAALKELGDIKVLIGNLVNQIGSILLHPESPIDERQLEFTMNDIKNKLGPLHTIIENLEDKASKCSREISEARDEVIRAAKGLARAKNSSI